MAAGGEGVKQARAPGTIAASRIDTPRGAVKKTEALFLLSLKKAFLGGERYSFLLGPRELMMVDSLSRSRG